MPNCMTRGDLLRGRLSRPSRSAAAVRPPWALDEAAFREACRDCALCLEACPERIIVADDEGRARVDFAKGGCTFCRACLEACPTGALADRGQAPFPHVAAIPSSCLSWQGVVCRLCEESCEARAIRFRPALGGYSLPEIDEAACTGCGACLAACPTGTIELRGRRT